MTTPTLFQSIGISIGLFKPTIDTSTPSYNPKGHIIESDLAFKVTGYQHNIQALGGYWSATLNINYNLVNAEDWIDRLGYHIEVYDPSLDKIWEGFVNRVKLGVGSLSVTRGPLIDVGNRGFVMYSTVDTSTTPPTVGMRETTATAENTDSQDKYGIIEKSISVGGVAPTDATQLRNTWLAENALPETGQTFNSGSGSTPNVTIECLGYVHWLNLFTYNDTTSGTREISAAIADIFNYEAASVNGMFSTDLSGIVTPGSTVSVNRYTNDNNTAWNRIKFLVSHGEGNDDRTLFGIYNDLKPQYDVIPTDTAYQQRISDPKQRIETPQGLEVKPWNVLPGQWLLYTDFLVGKVPPANKRDDPRYEFIESVIYTAPWGLTHTGNKAGTLSQKLAKLGLAGAGS